MRLFAEEKQLGTQVVLRTAPVSDTSVVLGKYSAALIYLTGLTLLTLPMPLLVMMITMLLMLAHQHTPCRSLRCHRIHHCSVACRRQ